jgi:ribosome-associated translation inhibitor RaiA
MELKPVEMSHGEKFGQLTVLGKVKTKNGVRWRCGCRCGFSGVLVRTNDLLKGRVTSCLKCSQTT